MPSAEAANMSGAGVGRVPASISPAPVTRLLDVPVDHLAMPVFTAHYRRCSSSIVVVAPDVRSAKMARGFASLNDAGHHRRRRRNASPSRERGRRRRGHDCIVDDMIDTAGTVEPRGRRNLGAKDIYIVRRTPLLQFGAVASNDAPIKKSRSRTIAIETSGEQAVRAVGRQLLSKRFFTRSNRSVRCSIDGRNSRSLMVGGPQRVTDGASGRSTGQFDDSLNGNSILEHNGSRQRRNWLRAKVRYGNITIIWTWPTAEARSWRARSMPPRHSAASTVIGSR